MVVRELLICNKETGEIIQIIPCAEELKYIGMMSIQDKIKKEFIVDEGELFDL